MMNEFRLSSWEDIIPLRRLWQDTFHDEDWYLDLFFRCAYAPERCMVAQNGDGIIAAAYWLECRLGTLRLAYLYAVAVHEGYRNQRLGRRLMEAIHTHLGAQGFHATLLVPGGEDARRFYRRLGYRDGAWQDRFNVRGGSHISIQQLDAEAYIARRREWLGESGVVQEGESLRLLQELADCYTGDGFLAAISPQEKVCLEFLGDRTQAAGLVGTLGMAECEIRTPGTSTPYAMVLPLGEESLPERFWFGFGFE